MPSTIHSILDEFRTAATSKRGMGDAFERLIATYLVTDPIYAERFTDVWLWAEWPNRSGADTGIDLVAKERATGDYCAIQCKFYDPKTQLRQEDLASFFATAGRKFATNDGAKQFTSLLVVSTTDRWSANAEKLMIDQGIPATRLRVQDLQESPIDWSQFSLDRPTELKLQAKKTPRAHQQAALADIATGFASNDRGKLVMACGTGKTYTSLMVAEARAGKAGLVLFLVPSINLLQQTLREWTAQTNVSMRCFAVCSDSKVGRRAEDIAAHDLALPATTDPAKLVQAVTAIRHADPEAMIVVFSTYQSIDVISRAQKAGLPTFSLAICDEAHRTTGVILEDAEESQFVRIHNEEHVKAHKRLYMTATPRLYADAARTRAEEGGAELCSMDDAALYGPEFHKLSFGEAVARGLLADYKVLVLAVDQKYVDSRLQRVLADDNNEINLDDVTKIIGCWNGLSKRFKGEGAENEDPAPMRRAVAFSRSIRDSKHIASTFQTVINEYVDKHAEDEGGAPLRCEVDHVDGTFNVLERNRLLDWLKEPAPENTCRILSNARCLSEGVDVPALDAVLFLNPRDSVVDVVQSVGRVMRAVPGKKYGYVILPISVPAGIAPEIALRDNDRYRVVWQVLQALRAHDDRFNATINQIELNKQRPNNIQVIGVGGGEGERGEGAGNGGAGGGAANQFAFDFPDIEIWRDAIYARIVLKCGDRRYWEQWAGEVALIAARHTTRLRNLLEEHPDARKAFQAFLDGLHENINPTISEEEAIEMLGQHLITRPVFDALFEGYSFTKNNAVSQAMQAVLNVLEGQALEKEVEQLQAFYRSVRTRVEKIDNAEGKQRVIVELYDKFFKQAFPKMAERLGIVYTPVEVVDFIINSAEHALQEHFGVGLTDKNVHILDPFTGTGTFLVRLLQSGHIKPKDLERKYKEELHANEIVLLAYYIAAINIEETYHGIKGGDYEPFDGIVLTDTFQLAEDSKQGGFGETMFPENNKRVKRQKARDIRVIVGNPPYSAQQDSENDNNKNLEYPILDDRIRTTYAAQSNAKLKKNLYDSYIRAIRWASDRIRSEGIIGFVTNGSFIDANNMDGLRKCLVEEFSTVYCFNLRGNQRTSGETSRREGGKIFGSGSRTPVAITLLIKSPKETLPGRLFYHDIGDYLTREEKLAIVHQFASTQSLPWKAIAPNADGDWVNQRNPEFETFVPIGQKVGGEESVFWIGSLGVSTNRDAWVYNSSSHALGENVRRFIRNYNDEIGIASVKLEGLNGKVKRSDLVARDATKIAWSSSLLTRADRNDALQFDETSVVCSSYRPFNKQWHYLASGLNDRPGKALSVFPRMMPAVPAIVITGVGASKPFSVLMTDRVPNLHFHDTSQYYPLYSYVRVDTSEQSQSSIAMGDEIPDADGYVRRDAITDWALSEYRRVYGDGAIGKEDIFYYVYGVLHSPEYRSRFESSLKKMLPRMPYLKDFWAYSKIGRELAHWHLNYDAVEPYALIEDSADLALEPKEHYRVEKMVFAKKAKAVDKSTIIFNSRVRLGGIPSEAYEYIVNGKSAIEWVMERYQVTVDKDSGIRNDPNDWSEDPRYIVDLVKRVVRVSVETMRLVGELPEFELVSIK